MSANPQLGRGPQRKAKRHPKSVTNSPGWSAKASRGTLIKGIRLMKHSWGDETTYWKDGQVDTDEERRIIAEARNAALEEAAKFVEENYEEPFINIVGNPSWRERGPKKLAAAIRALKARAALQKDEGEMTDIVERLRARIEYLYEHSQCGKPDHILLTEAADEIERLRAEKDIQRDLAKKYYAAANRGLPETLSAIKPLCDAIDEADARIASLEKEKKKLRAVLEGVVGAMQSDPCSLEALYAINAAKAALNGGTK